MSALIRNFPTGPVEIDRRGLGESLLLDHNRYFSTVLADTPSLLEAAYALRFQVYCLERGFENAEEHPDGLETDPYDDSAIHGVLFHRPTKRPIGTARLIVPNKGIADSLPIMKLLQQSSLELSHYVDISRTVEISRFAVSKEFRRRNSDDAEATVPIQISGAREASLSFLSLLQFALRESIRNNVLFWTAVMEPKLLRLLARMGICYTPIGPQVVHHGIRQPCFCYVPEMLESARRIQPQCWEVLTDGGILQDQFAYKLTASIPA